MNAVSIPFQWVPMPRIFKGMNGASTIQNPDAIKDKIDRLCAYGFSSHIVK